ncbi:hypothetical protein [Vineibacter terrae]|uniref:hypothetical protein n=1 Tax=Vineibacter terrae TaxID=2586908 RepID=UPI0015B4B4BA|nr:hypothetical protein [Vineibacter terrae]
MAEKPATLDSICEMLQEVLEHQRVIRQDLQECIVICDRIIETFEDRRKLGDWRT